MITSEKEQVHVGTCFTTLDLSLCNFQPLKLPAIIAGFAIRSLHVQKCHKMYAQLK